MLFIFLGSKPDPFAVALRVILPSKLSCFNIYPRSAELVLAMRSYVLWSRSRLPLISALPLLVRVFNCTKKRLTVPVNFPFAEMFSGIRMDSGTDLDGINRRRSVFEVLSLEIVISNQDLFTS